MINTHSCDLCRTSLGNEVTRLEFVRGTVTFLPRERWSVRPSTAGIRVRMVCLSCDQFLRAAVQHLATLVDLGVANATSPAGLNSPAAPDAGLFAGEIAQAEHQAVA